MLVYSGSDLEPTGYTNSNFQWDKDSRKSTSGSVFTLGGGAVVWRSIKQSSIADSTMEAEYIAACEAAKEAVWLKKFYTDLEVFPEVEKPLVLYCDNSGAVANSKEPRSHKRGKHIERKYHLEKLYIEEMCPLWKSHQNTTWQTRSRRRFLQSNSRVMYVIWDWEKCLTCFKYKWEIVRSVS